MATKLRLRFLKVIAVLAFVPLSAVAADAAWVTIKNDTKETIVVQETIVVNGQSKRGKPTTLLAGEKFREFIPGPTVKKIEVFDSRNPSQLLWSGNLNCRDESQTFSVALAGGKASVTPVANPQPVPKK